MSGRSQPLQVPRHNGTSLRDGMVSGDWKPTVETVGYDGMSLRDGQERKPAFATTPLPLSLLGRGPGG